MKLLSFADLHYSKENAEKCFKILDFVCEKAEEIQPDFVTISGDVFEKGIVNSDAHGLPELKKHFDNIANVAPIIMIYGTPSRHDIPGSLEVFQSEKIKIARPEIPLIFNNTIFYCIPDAKPWEATNEERPTFDKYEINNYLANLCLYYGAYRRENQKMSAVVLGHGIVKNTKNSNDEIIKHSDVYNTEDNLKQIGADVYLFGHYHNGFDFETIPGRMLGGFAHNWNDLNYYPAIWEYEFSQDMKAFAKKEHRLDFIPRRIKIVEYSNEPYSIQYYNGDLIHLEKLKNDPTTIQDLIDHGAHPDSIVTIKPEIIKVIRNKDITAATTREDEYKSYAKQQQWEVSKKELQIVKDLEQEERRGNQGSEKKHILPITTHIRGFKQFINGMQKEEIKIAWAAFDQSLTGVTGKGGIGKSGLLSCIPPHSANIAQAESFNNLFILPDSFIVQEWRVNDDNITLKRFFKVGKKTTVDYQVCVNGEFKKEHSGSKSNYDNFVNLVFGSARMFALNLYQTQFSNNKIENGAAINPDIITADNAALKEIFTELLNIDRTFIFRQSLIRSKDAEANKITKSIEIEGFKKAINDPDELKDKIGIVINAKTVMEKNIFALENEKAELQTEKDLILSRKQKTQTAQQVIKLHDDRIKKAQEEIEKQNSYKNYKGESIEDLQKNIDAAKATKKAQEEIRAENEKLQNDYNLDIVHYNDAMEFYNDEKAKFEKNKNSTARDLQEIKNNISLLNQKKDNLLSQADHLKIPCEYCNKISSSSQRIIEYNEKEANGIILKINEFKIILENKEKELQAMAFSLIQPQQPQKPILKPFDNSLQSKIDNMTEKLQQVITMDQKAAHADQEIDRLNKEIEALKLLIKDESKKITTGIEEQEKINNDDISTNEKFLKQENDKLNELNASIKSLNDALESIDAKTQKLAGLELELQEIEADYFVWSRMVTAWGRDGIPAMILENAAPEVDYEVNKLLEKYYNKLMIETSTLRDKKDGKGTIEDFNIFVINTITGDRYNISGLSGEERNFILCAFREACRTIAERAQNRLFNLALMDEPDNNVSEDRLSDFWQMVKEIDQNKNRLRVVVSHSPTAKDMMQNKIEIENI